MVGWVVVEVSVIDCSITCGCVVVWDSEVDVCVVVGSEVVGSVPCS